MADRTSAELFATLYETLAFPPPNVYDFKSLAHFMYNVQQHYDFNDNQMGCDLALETLGLDAELKEMRRDA